RFATARAWSSLSSRRANPRARHSFPTRRSSDLQRGHRDRRAPDPRRGRGRGGRRGTARAGRGLAVPAPAGGGHHALGSLHVDRRDRKSTRLNSSHVKISYAVICLKKKNNNNNTT